jgi:5-methylcytosine-specific restriction endonuclease McrA
LAIPTAEEQIHFVDQLQRLLNEGSFTATLKFALLMALADLAVERGDDSGGSLSLTTRDLAPKFIEYYWRQTRPYHSGKSDVCGDVLSQNNDKQLKVLRELIDYMGDFESLTALRSDSRAWSKLSTAIADNIRAMPLWKLQTVGSEKLGFLYPNDGAGSGFELSSTAVYSLRRFYPWVVDMVQAAWTRRIQSYKANAAILGTVLDLREFLFGSDRSALAKYQPLLWEVQEGRCFYCKRPLPRLRGQVDHFIPWSRYPIDLGHNFVLADDRCNGYKSDRLAASEHLTRWVDRNRMDSSKLTDRFDQSNLYHDLDSTGKIAVWAYGQAAVVGAQTWVNGADGLQPLEDGWRSLLIGESIGQ